MLRWRQISARGAGFGNSGTNRRIARLFLGSARDHERLPDQLLDRRLFGVGCRVQGDVPRLLAAPLEYATCGIEVAAAIVEQGGVLAEGADARHVLDVHRVADYLT